MRMYLGEHVRTSDGQDAGTIDKVIVDPEHDRVTTVVLREGQLFHHDVEVTLDQLIEGPDGQLRLSFSLDQLKDLPHFEEGSYTTPPSDTTFLADYPAGSVLWPGGWIGDPVPPVQENPPGMPYGGDLKRRSEINARLDQQYFGNAVIGPGSGIYSRDDHKVGTLDRLAFDGDGRLAGLVVRQGLFFPKEFELSGALVDSAADGRIYLNLDRDRVTAVARGEPVHDEVPGRPASDPRRTER